MTIDSSQKGWVTTEREGSHGRIPPELARPLGESASGGCGTGPKVAQDTDNEQSLEWARMS